MDTLDLARADEGVQGAVMTLRFGVYWLGVDTLDLARADEGVQGAVMAMRETHAWAGPTATVGSRRGRPPATRGRGGPSARHRCTATGLRTHGGTEGRCGGA